VLTALGTLILRSMLHRFVRWYESSAAADDKGSRSSSSSSAVSATTQESAAATVETVAVVAHAPDNAAAVAHTVKYTDSANADVAATTAQFTTAGDAANTVINANASTTDTVLLGVNADSNSAVVADVVQSAAAPAAAAAPTATAAVAAAAAAAPPRRTRSRSGGVRIRSSGAVVVEGSYPTTANTLRTSSVGLPAPTSTAFAASTSGASSGSTAALSTGAAAATAKLTQEQRREQWLAGGVATVTAADFAHLEQAQGAAAAGVNAADELWRSLEIVKVRVALRTVLFNL
jgi:hypothetical protein